MRSLKDMLMSISLAAGVLMLPASAGMITFTTDGSTPWTVSVPSQGISNATPDSGYLTDSITPFPGAGNCTVPACYDTFDGFWTGAFDFTLPADAMNVTLNFSGLSADDRAVLELNGTPIGNGYGGTSSVTGNMTLTDGGPNGTYGFGGSTSEMGTVSTGFNVGGSNTLLLIVNNTQTGVSGPLTGNGFTTAGVTGDVTFTEIGGSPVPEPGPGLLLLSGCIALLLRQRFYRMARVSARFLHR